ncbi:MAG: tetratricopeptide repeat protein [Desulfobacterales bacterium]|nr:tetratricopeptide repeat protein [Desulfobacterales bacterium]
MKKILVSVLLVSCLITLVHAQTEKALFESGVAQMKADKYHEAIETFTRLIDMVPGNPDVYKNRGVAHMKLNQYDKAIADFEKTREIKPDLKGLYSNLGVAWYYKGDYIQAVKNYNMEISLTPDNYYAYFNRAICRAELQEYDLSLKDVETALSFAPKFYLALCLKGDILAKTGHYNKARDAYKQAVALDPDHPYAGDQLAELNRKYPAEPAPEAADLVVKKELPKKARTIPGHKVGDPAPKTASVSGDEPKFDAMKSPEPEATKEPQPSKTPRVATDPIPRMPELLSGYELQAGAFGKQSNAEKRHRVLQNEGYPARVVVMKRPSGKTWFLVRMGAYKTKSAAKADLETMKEKLDMDIIVRPAGRF